MGVSPAAGSFATILSLILTGDLLIVTKEEMLWLRNVFNVRSAFDVLSVFDVAAIYELHAIVGQELVPGLVNLSAAFGGWPGHPFIIQLDILAYLRTRG